MRPGTFTSSFTDQVESLFIPAFVSLANFSEICVKEMDLTSYSLFRE